MIQYTILLDETIAEFFEEIAIIAKRSVKEIISNALFKQVEIIKQNVAESFVMDKE